jgi:hypothetical protein
MYAVPVLHFHAESCDENSSEEDLVVSEDGAESWLERGDVAGVLEDRTCRKSSRSVSICQSQLRIDFGRLQLTPAIVVFGVVYTVGDPLTRRNVSS